MKFYKQFIDKTIDEIIFDLDYIISNVFDDIYNYFSVLQREYNEKFDDYDDYEYKDSYILDKLNKLPFNSYDIELFYFYSSFSWKTHKKFTSKNNVRQQYKKFTNKYIDIKIEKYKEKLCEFFSDNVVLCMLEYLLIELKKCFDILMNNKTFKKNELKLTKIFKLPRNYIVKRNETIYKVKYFKQTFLGTIIHHIDDLKIFVNERK